MRDRQTQRVYEWEDFYIEQGEHPISTGYDLRAFVNMVCTDYGLPLPHIRNIGYLTAGQTRTGLSLPSSWAWDKVVVLHELAHWASPPRTGHNPVWVRQFITFLSQYAEFDAEALVEHAEEMSVRIK